MACNDCDDYSLVPDECAEDCGCDKHYDAACVRFNKKDLPCVDKPKGTDLEQIIEEIDSKLCGVSDGSDGLSAYEIAVSNGFSGTEAEWLESLNGDDCSCEEIVLYREEGVLDISGTWGEIVDISTASTSAVASYTLTAPSNGDYEVTLQGTLDATAGGEVISAPAGIYTDVLIDGTPLANSGSASTIYHHSAPYAPVTLFQSNITLTAGQTIAIGLATNAPNNVVLINSKLQIKKLA